MSRPYFKPPTPAQHPGFASRGGTELRTEQVVLPAGYEHVPGGRKLPTSLIFERDQSIPLREGGNLYADVFRAENATNLPTVMMWTPYGKTNKGVLHYTLFPNNVGVPLDKISWLNCFEGLDPAEWACLRGYAIVHVDALGSCFSDGDLEQWTQREAESTYDAIDWISKQPWSNGAVGMSGNSWLAASQINVASRRPHPALKAIAPWEALTDSYRDNSLRGGIPNKEFAVAVFKGFAGHNRVEDIATLIAEHPTLDELWQEKVLPIEQLETPMYVLASYSTGLHVHGSVRLFRDTKKLKNKWLRWHLTHEWPDLYQDDNTEDLNKFFDHFLRGKTDNGWLETPPVRLSLLDFHGAGVVNRPETEYPLNREKLVTLYLDAKSGTMGAQKPSEKAQVSYEAHHESDLAAFRYTFDRPTEVVGFSKARLWISCDTTSHLDVHVQLRKLSKDGKLLQHSNFDHGPFPPLPINISQYLGPDGCLRASMRETLDEAQSTLNEPFYKFDQVGDKLQPGQIVALDIPIWPAGIAFEAGESIELHVAGHSLRLPEFPQLAGLHDQNSGRHTIYTGGQEYDSCLVLPFVGA